MRASLPSQTASQNKLAELDPEHQLCHRTRDHKGQNRVLNKHWKVTAELLNAFFLSVRVAVTSGIDSAQPRHFLRFIIRVLVSNLISKDHFHTFLWVLDTSPESNLVKRFPMRSPLGKKVGGVIEKDIILYQRLVNSKCTYERKIWLPTCC